MPTAHQTKGQKCLRLKHDIQDLIDSGKIEPPRANRPNVTTNPLPTHAVLPPANINMIEPTLSSW
jgi:hypothetical protein